MISALLKPSVVINGKKYKIMKQIGEGGFAFVYDVLGTGKESGDHFALKKMICQTEEQLDEAKKEIETMLRLKNPNILELIDHAYTTNKKNQKEALLLLPLFQGSAQTIIDHGQVYPYCGFSSGPDVLKILRHIVEGLKVIHAAGLRHADLKPANILLTSTFDAVITDFGSVSPIPLVIHSRAEALSAQDKAASCTTASYRAPELYNTPSSCVLGGESDVWSFGCLMYCLFYSRSPFETAVEGLSTLSIISAHYQIPENNIWPAEYLEVMASCLQADPTKRASLATLQEKLQSLPSPPLSTQPVGNSSPHSQGSSPHMTHVGASTATTATTTAAHAGHHNHHAEAKAQAKLASSTSTTSSAVSSSHLEFSETSSYPNTPTSPSMANFADFPDPAAGSTANAALDQAVAVEESYVLSHLTDEQAASVEFASGSALSEMVLEDSSSGHSDLRHRHGSHSSITFSLGHHAGSISTASVNNGSAYGSVHGSAYGSATNGGIADSYVHAEETLSHCSSGSGQNSPMFVPHADGSASVLNLPAAPVPVRRGLSTPTTHNSQCSFDFVESSHVDFSSSAGNSTNVSPRTLVSAEDAAMVDTAPNATAAGALNGSNSHANSFTSHPAAAPGIAETVEEGGGWESDEEFGDFTTSTITATATASTTFTPNNTASSVFTASNTAANTKRPEEESNPRLPLQEVDLWKLIAEQAQPTAPTDQGGNHSHSQAGTTSSRYTIKEGPVYMMRQGGFPKRWAKKQVWLILTPLGLILRKDSSPTSRIHEVLSLHRPLHTTSSDTLSIGLNGLRVQGSTPVQLGSSGHSSQSDGEKRARSQMHEEGDWVTVTLGGASALTTDSSTHLSSTVTSSDSTDNHSNHSNGTTSGMGRCLFVPAAFEISFDDKDVMNAWLDVIDEQREILL